MAIRQLDEKELQAISDFLDKTEESTVGMDAPLLRPYIEHQRKSLEILDKFKKEG